MRKLAVSLSDSTELRVILSVLYIMTEVLRNHENEALREGFKSELSKTSHGSSVKMTLPGLVLKLIMSIAPETVTSRHQTRWS
jgi:hypothetical protein